MAEPSNSWVDKMVRNSPLGIPTGDQQEAIADITVTGTYADDDEDIEATLNGILAVLRSYGMIASS